MTPPSKYLIREIKELSRAADLEFRTYQAYAARDALKCLVGGNLVLYPDAGMRAAASHATAIEGPRGSRIGKTNPRHKIDVIVALAMAAHAALQDQGKPRGFLEMSGWESDAEEKSSTQSRHRVADLQAVESWCRAIYVESNGQWWG